MTTTTATQQLGRVWFENLSENSTSTDGSLLTGEIELNGITAALAAIVPDPDSPFPRARNGEVGLRESLELAQWVGSLEDPTQPIIMIIDVPSQAYGYFEELFGINFTLATSVNALAKARLDGHPIISLIVGKAISGAFLATGLQSNRILSLTHEGVQVQVMSKQAAARITQRTIAELDEAAESVPAMAFDGASFRTLGAVHDAIDNESVINVKAALGSTLADIQDTTLNSRLESPEAQASRALSIQVREAVNDQW